MNEHGYKAMTPHHTDVNRAAFLLYLMCKSDKMSHTYAGETDQVINLMEKQKFEREM